MNQTLERAHDGRDTTRSQGLLPPRGPDENLDVADGTRILCTALRVDQHQMFVGAFGPEQTRIIYTFAGILAEYRGVNIRSVCTSRTEDAAGSYILLGDISGNAEALVELGQDIQIKPWLEPAGTKVIPDAVIDLKIIAPARRTLLLDALSIISGNYGINIESMVHRTFHNMFDHGFDLLRQVSRAGVDGVLPKARRGRGNAAPGGPGNGGPGNGGPGNGGPGNGGPGNSGPGNGGPGTDPSVRDGDGGEFIAVTHMRLELPDRSKLEDLMHDLELVGRDWDLRWEQRAGQGKFDLKLAQKLFGELN